MTYGPAHTDDAPPRPAKQRNTVVIVSVTAAVTALAIVAVLTVVYMRASDAKATPTAFVGGRVVLLDTDPTVTNFTWDKTPPTCTGDEKYTDLVEGAPVEVRDMDGQLLGVAKLGPGIPGQIKEDTLLGETSETAGECGFRVSSASVPARQAYKVTVGRRPAVTVPGGDIGRMTVRLGG